MNFKFVIEVDFDLFYHPVLELLKSEVIYLRYDLQEKKKTAPRVTRNFIFGVQVDFCQFYHPVLEFLRYEL